MPVLQRACLVLGAVAALTAVVGAAPVRRASWGPAGQRLMASARGELVRVDPDARRLVIKLAEGMEVPFVYTDHTKVIGSETGVAGLAAMTGARVMVRYTTEGKDRVALEIDIHART